jgi:hypothetical protein
MCRATFLGLVGAVTCILCGRAVNAQQESWLADERSEFEQTAYDALDRVESFDFDEAPFSRLIDYLRDITKLDIVIDPKALATAEISGDAPVTIHLNHTSCKSALELVLDQLNLTWTFHHEVIFITTKPCDEVLTTKIYDVRDLLLIDRTSGLPDFQSLIELITSCIAPSTWDDVGGPGAIKAYQGPRVRALVISQSREMHNDIASLLADLRKLAKRAPAR